MHGILIGLSHNLALLLAFVFCYGLLSRKDPRSLTPIDELWHGVLFGCGAILAMLMPIEVLEGVIIDNRIAVVALAAPFAGVRGTAIALAMAIGQRWMMGGAGWLAGAAALTSAAVLGVAVRQVWSLQTRQTRVHHVLLIGLLTPLVTLPWVFAVPEVDHWSLLATMGLPVGIMYPLDTTALGCLLLWTRQSQDLRHQVEASERRFRMLVEGSPDAILIIDQADGRVLDANPRACELVGGSLMDLLGRPLDELHAPPADAQQAEAWRRHFGPEGGGSGLPALDLGLRRSDGGILPVEVVSRRSVMGRRPVIIGFFRDLRERETAQLDLARAKALTDQIIQTANVLIVGLDGQGSVALFNAHAEEVTGWTLAELSGRPYAEALCTAGNRLEVGNLIQALMARGGSDESEYAIRTRDGEERLIAWSTSSISDVRAPIRLIAIGIDVTERHLQEARLRQVDKMAAIGTLAGGIAHDFNNQLQIIHGTASLLALKLPEGALRNQAQRILDGCSRSAEMIGKLLAFSRKAAVRRTPVDLHPLISSTVTLVGSSIDKRITLRCHLQAACSVVIGDETALQNALLNLLVNARDAMPTGGTITTSTWNERLDTDNLPDVDPPLEAGLFFCLRVADDGVGMTEEVLQRVFEPFFTTKPPSRGTGLGLAAVYGTVQEHGGTVAVGSTPGAGSAFTLYLPAAAEAAIEGPPLPQRPATALEDLHLLIIDDEDEVQELLVAGMRELLHCRASGFVDSQEALDWFREHPHEIDLAVVDLNMPRVNGSEVIRLLHGRRPDLPVILGTGMGPEAIDDVLRTDPRITILQKPYALQELAERVRRPFMPC